MASPTATVNVEINHVLHTSGAVEATGEDQNVDKERLNRLVNALHEVVMAHGWGSTSVELIQSINRRGHLPELHVVLVQLPEGVLPIRGRL